MKLVIVESPTKGRTIEKYLGKDYQVQASFGHIRDLPSKQLGIDIEHDFEPKYVIIPKARKTISQLKGAAQKAEEIYLATDYDREGEAIAWHITEALGLGAGKARTESKTPHRIIFHEITKEAILEAIKHPRTIDMNLVDAQQGRRVLDRLVGYTLSPFLWKKVMKGLSAGRVQSVAVRLIVDREKEITAFKSQEYWTITAMLADNNTSDEIFEATLVEWQGEKLEKLTIGNQAQAQKITDALKTAQFVINSIEEKETFKYPLPPFTTSTLQQDAANRLRFSAKKTMKLAQDLYESGKITYMRTDSTNLASSAIDQARRVVLALGRDYLPLAPKTYKTKSKSAQEAHEAIRPTHPDQKMANLNFESNDHAALYDLIWRRLIASQINPAKIKTITLDIGASEGKLRATGNQIIFDGFTKIWPTKLTENMLPQLKNKQELDLKDLVSLQHFTEPPPRYSEATLVKTLEEYGIGRPATYAPTIATILDRGYVKLENRRFYPTEIGTIVTDLLIEHFPQIVDTGFTAKVEADLDLIAQGDKKWEKIINDFYHPYAAILKEKQETVAKKQLAEETQEICPKCGKKLLIRMGRFGKFYACSGFPECRFTKQFVQTTGIACPDCGSGEIIVKRTKKGKPFWGCNRYPDCKYASWNQPQVSDVNHQETNK